MLFTTQYWSPRHRTQGNRNWDENLTNFPKKKETDPADLPTQEVDSFKYLAITYREYSAHRNWQIATTVWTFVNYEK